MYGQLRALAVRHLAEERVDHTLQATALVNETYLKLVDQTRAAPADRNHVMAVAAEAMRRILVDHARKKRAEKRGGDRARLPLEPQVPLDDEGGTAVDLTDLGEALDRVSKLDDRARRVVELRYVAGFTKEETAEILGVSRATAGRQLSPPAQAIDSTRSLLGAHRPRYSHEANSAQQSSALPRHSRCASHRLRLSAFAPPRKRQNQRALAMVCGGWVKWGL